MSDTKIHVQCIGVTLISAPSPQHVCQTVVRWWVICLCFLTTGGASADDRTIAWQVTSVLPSDRAPFVQAIAGTLSQAEGRHLVRDGAFEDYVRDQPLRIPECFEGLRPCGERTALLIEVLDLDGWVEAHVDRSETGDYQVELRYWRAFGGAEPSEQVAVQGPELGPLVLQAIDALFTLEAQLVVVSDPPDATVYVNGTYVGTSPITLSLGEGGHVLRLESDGYETYRSEITLTPGEQRRYEASLEPELTQVTVRTRAEGAQVWIDDVLLGSAGKPIDVAPGSHRVELRAEGYHPIGIGFEIGAAERRTLHLAMLREVEDPWVLRQRGIERYRLHVQAGYALQFQSARFAAASVEMNGATFRPTSFERNLEAGLIFNGVSISTGLTWGMWGLEMLELVMLDSTELTDIVLNGDNGETLTVATGGNVTHFGLKPLQGTFRYLEGPWVAEASTGIGVGFDSLTVETGGQELSFGLVHAFWALQAAGRFYWGEQWFAELSYGLEIDLAADRGVRHGLVLGVGYHLPFAMFGEDEASEGEVEP